MVRVYTFGDLWALLGTFGHSWAFWALWAPKSGVWAGFGHCPTQNPFGRPKCHPGVYLSYSISICIVVPIFSRENDIHVIIMSDFLCPCAQEMASGSGLNLLLHRIQKQLTEKEVDSLCWLFELTHGETEEINKDGLNLMRKLQAQEKITKEKLDDLHKYLCESDRHDLAKLVEEYQDKKGSSIFYASFVMTMYMTEGLYFKQKCFSNNM